MFFELSVKVIRVKIRFYVTLKVLNYAPFFHLDRILARFEDFATKPPIQELTVLPHTTG